ncbi:MAG: amidohydrolase family protein [Chthoniobacterales bacterium]
MTVHRARVVMPMNSPPIEDGAVIVSGAEIVEVGPFRNVDRGNAEVVDHGEVVLLPGLINAHCHLDYTTMRGAILERRSFAAWVRRINELKRTLTDDDYLAAIARGFSELKHWGTTTVLNVEAFPELMPRLPRPPIRTWWFYEMLDLRNRIHTDDVVAGALSFFDARPEWDGGFGLSPHAPYSTSMELYRLARSCAETTGMPFMTHLAESEEEMSLFAGGDGPMFDFLQKLGRDMGDTGGRSPIELMLSGGALPTGAILVHMNHVTAADQEALSERAGEFHIVHCPGCHDYFDRPPFPYELHRRLGFPVSLGTDSCASNRGLNLFAEMRTFRRNFPSVSPEDILAMVTRNPAAALGLSESLGVLKPGAKADLIAVAFDGPLGEAVESVCENVSPPCFVKSATQSE